MKTLIFDFDQTIADTSALEPLRRARNWSSVYASLHRIKIYPGMLDLLEKGRSKGYRIAVVTNSPRKYCELALSSLGIKADAVVGYHDTSRRKPNPDPVLLALKLAGGTPSESFGLGDTVNDLAAYKAAGVTPVACLWGCVNAKELTMAMPCITVSSALEMLNHLITSPSEV
ncbi:HAD family hydrolase [Pontibacter silvestris]|uniref:phosphoglycolate phosphatase n=1 Tax=Pontibacter silvestris TaxID=2305183 RepID=A0ABW4WW79_9BACT|nr:HAD-IIIA family hydrolase [Pontibacter silvestris]MCC9138930.1 HAD-IIIA family hydrolase [Pontibacter silvestris]